MSAGLPPEPSVASIDDLLGFGEEPAVDEARTPSPVRRWVKHALIVAVATAALLGAFRIAGVQLSPVLALAAVLSLWALQRVVRAVAPPPPPKPVARPHRGDQRSDVADGLRTVVRRWEQQLAWSQTDAERFSRNVQPVLVELADERLRLRHGITRATDPRRARALLGGPLWRLLADPDRPPPKPRELAAHVETLEQL
ncbi:MAG TPA: hypothetical protein VFO77_00635 [Actinoplanes sp.]|nr:hypothetical protein [Actinoplanes sp.]